MDTDITYTAKKIGLEGRGPAAGIRSVVRKIAGALTFNADAVFKSEDWPHLWPKKR
jgi:hypothetical protein